MAAKYEFEDRNNIKTARLTTISLIFDYIVDSSVCSFSHSFHKHLEHCCNEPCD